MLKSFRIFAIIVLTAVALSASSDQAPGTVSVAQQASQDAADYLSPESVKPGGGKISQPKHNADAVSLYATQFSSATGPFPQSRTTYTTFDGRVYTLNAFDGKHVQVLVPDSWLDPARLPTPELWRLVDAADTTYDLYAELTGHEPSGAGPQRIAFVPVPAPNFGLGLVGSKGVELSDTQQSATAVVEELTRGRFFAPLAHESEHNFDLATGHANRRPADAHAWTSLAHAAALYWTRAYDQGQEPSQRLKLSTAQLRGYAADPSVTWTQATSSPPWPYSPNEVWSGTALRIAELKGADATLKYFRGLNATRAPGLTTPSDARAVDDNQIRALSTGSDGNALCAAALWRWPVSAAAAAELTAAFPGPTPSFCADADGDNHAPLAGDCNDGNAAINPSAVESPNELDDDCDGITDNVVVTEAELNRAPDLPSIAQGAPSLPFGSRLAGTLTSGSDVDFVRVSLQQNVVRQTSATTHYAITLRSKSPGSTAEARLFRNDGTDTGVVINTQNLTEPANRIFVAAPGQTVSVRVHKRGGDPSSATPYELTLSEGAHWPDDDPTLSNPQTQADGNRRLEASWSDEQWAALQSRGVTHVRFWVSGEGWVGTRPASQLTTLDWAPPPGDTRVRGYRVEPVSSTNADLPPRPVASLSQPYFFNQPEGPAVEQPAKRPDTPVLRAGAPLPADARPAPDREGVTTCVAPLSTFRVNFAADVWTSPWSPDPPSADTAPGDCRHFPTNAAGWTVTLAGRACEITAVRRAQPDPNNGQPRMEVEAIAPADLTSGSVPGAVLFNGSAAAHFTACVSRVSLSLWKTDDGFAVGVFDLTLQSISNRHLDLASATPIEGRNGRTIILFGTGFRLAPDSDASNNSPGTKNSAEFFSPARLLWADGSGKTLDLPVSYAGEVPQGPCGLDQINVFVPLDAAGAGVATLLIKTPAFDGKPQSSETVKLSIK